MQDPKDNPIKVARPRGVAANSLALGVDYLNDYNPLVQGSFLYWGAPTLYSVPALLAGLVQNFTGIPNEFVGIGSWSAQAGSCDGKDAGPANLIAGVPAGSVPGAGSARIPEPRHIYRA